LSEQVDNARGLLEVFASQTGLKSTNVDGIPVLREFQEMELYNASSFRVSEEELFEALMKRYPEWRNPTTYQQRIMRSDTMGAMRENLGCYSGMTGNILENAVNVYFVAQRGGDQNAALEKVQQSIDIWNSTQKILELKIETGISLPNLGEALSEGLRIYQENVDIFYNLQGMKKREMTKQEYRAINQFWQNTYIVRADGVVARRDGSDGGGGTVVVSVGEPIASAGGGIAGESTEQPKSRSWQRADRLWKNAVNTYIVNGYGSPHVKNYVDNVQGKPNEQRDRWIESMTTVIAGITKEVTPEDETPDETPETDPTQPDVGVAGEVVAGLQRVIDAGMEGIKVEKQLKFGAELEAALIKFNKTFQPSWANNQTSTEFDQAQSELETNVLNKIWIGLNDIDTQIREKAYEVGIKIVHETLVAAAGSYNIYAMIGNKSEELATNIANAISNAYHSAMDSGATAVEELMETSGLPPVFMSWMAVNDVSGYRDLVDQLGEVAVNWAGSRHGTDVNDEVGLRNYHMKVGDNLTNEEIDRADSEDYKKLIINKIFLHQEGTPEKAGKIVIIILGQAQDLGDTEAGLYNIARAKAANDGYEVLTFRVGKLKNELVSETNLLPQFKMHPEVVLEHTKNVIQDRIAGRGMFEGMPKITEVSGIMYSWGGGTANRLFGTEANTRELLGDIKPTALAYIDAVQHPFWSGFGQAVENRPYCDNFYNSYQTNAGSWPTAVIPNPNGEPTIAYSPNIFKGETINGTFINGAYNGKWDLGSNGANHLSIDEKAFDENYGRSTPLDILSKFSNP
ncbi:hypothetical protein KJ652_04965, partial [Patescibacteria group bacterium]|nr:hypothetical protein [Patescibacteria group bacterium]MBU1123917.1 hypothetical protein [Patescibacteria group bacterium]